MSEISFKRFDEAAHRELIAPLTDLLHDSYAPLAAQGMKYLATHQPPEKTLERLSEGESYLIFQKECLIGTVTLYRPKFSSSCEYYRKPGVLSFGQFAVKRDLQSRGIGSRTMDMLELRAKELGAKELALDTSEKADALISMYKKRGYEIVDRTKWEVTNYTSVIMSKPLQ